MYLVRKCEDWQGRGKCSWKTIFTSPERAGAIAVFKQEFRLVLESDPNLTRDTINGRMNNYYLDQPDNSYYTNRRVEMGHGNTGFAIYKSHAVANQTPAERPDRTSALDSILN